MIDNNKNSNNHNYYYYFNNYNKYLNHNILQEDPLVRQVLFFFL